MNTFTKNIFVFSQLGADQQFMGAKHLHLQSQDFPCDRCPLQARRAVDRPEEENLLQVGFCSCIDVQVS